MKTNTDTAAASTPAAAPRAQAGPRKPLMALASALLLAGCAVKPEPFTSQDFAAAAVERKHAIGAEAPPVLRPMTLPDAVARAVKYNLDARVRVMEQAQALGQLDAAQWDLLPKIAAKAGYDVRSEYNSSVSRTLYSRTNSTSEPTFSSDREVINADLTLGWNLLDFGVGYFQAKVQADRTLIAAERRRKSLHVLTQDVRTAWWRAATAQRLRGDVASTLTAAKAALDALRREETEGLRNPIETLRQQRVLVEYMRQLETIEQDLAVAKAELASLIGVPPGTNFSIAVPADAAARAPKWAMPIARMEEVALLRNADLHESMYNERISVQETRKAIMRMLPGVGLSVGRNYNSNSFLVANDWYGGGAQIAWNLVNVLSGPEAVRAAQQGEDVAKARSLAMHMAVLSQAHIALRQYEIAVKQYERATDLNEIDRRVLAHSAARQAADAQGELERVANGTAMILSLLRRHQALAQVHAALGRIHATLGLDPLPDETADGDVQALAKAIERHFAGLEGGSLNAGGAPSSARK